MSFDEMEVTVFSGLPSSVTGRFIDPAEVANLVVSSHRNR
jgi:hypothetical protein